jgi:hypothetical protein
MNDQTSVLDFLGSFAMFFVFPVFCVFMLLWDPKKTVSKVCDKLDKIEEKKGIRLVLHPVVTVVYYLFLTVVVLIGAFFFTILPLGGATIIGFAIGLFGIFQKARTSAKLGMHPSWIADDQHSVSDIRQTLSKIFGRGFEDN